MTNDLIKALESDAAFEKYYKNNPEYQIISDIKAYAQPDRVKMAAQLMQGMLANPNVGKQKDGSAHTYETLAQTVLNATDALIAELNKRG